MQSVQLKKGVLDLCVLGRLSTGDTYGYDIYQSINKVLGISESTIYPILRKMVNEGYLTTYLQESPDGPPRKYFKITKKGLEMYHKMYQEWQTLVRQVDYLIMR